MSIAIDQIATNWLPAGKLAAVCLTVDDVHPSDSNYLYEAGGDLERGALRHWLWLRDKHPELKATFFATADWQLTYSYPVFNWLRELPEDVSNQMFFAPILPKGTKRLDRHKRFAEFISNLENVEIALHGLSHAHRGPSINVEFQEQSTEVIEMMLSEIINIFERAGIPFKPGMCPPGWGTPNCLLEAMVRLNLKFVASSRDLFTAVTPDAVSDMSGLRGVSVIYPQFIHNRKLLHLPANFSPSCPIDRAFEIIENNGLLSFKCHIIKNLMGRVAIDGLDESYRNYIDLVVRTLKERYGTEIWWTTMGEITERVNSLALNTSQQ